METSIGIITTESGGKAFGFREANFAPDHFSPNEKIIQFMTRHPNMQTFEKKVGGILDSSRPVNNEEYIHSLEKNLIGFSNILQEYASDMAFSGDTVRVIANKTLFSNEFRDYIGERYQKLFPGISDIKKSSVVWEFESLFIEQLNKQLKGKKHVFGIKRSSEIMPIWLLVKNDMIIMVTPVYVMPDYMVQKPTGNNNGNIPKGHPYRSKI